MNLMKPAVIEAKNGKFLIKTPDEIFQVVLKKLNG